MSFYFYHTETAIYSPKRVYLLIKKVNAVSHSLALLTIDRSIDRLYVFAKYILFLIKNIRSFWSKGIRTPQDSVDWIWIRLVALVLVEGRQFVHVVL